MFGINYKYFFKENIEKKIEEYVEFLGIENIWNEVELGYADANMEIFTELHIDYKCTHPKKLYRPGNTVICHFLSIRQEFFEDYSEGRITKEQWEDFCLKSRQVSRGVTDALISTLQNYGREVSLLSELDEWSHLHGAEVAKLGTFEKNGYMYKRDNQIGFIGSIITETKIEN